MSQPQRALVLPLTIDRFVALALAAGVRPAQLALVWVLSRGDHVHAIPGTTRFDHLEENAATLAQAIPAEVLAEAGALINQQTVHGHSYHEPMR